MEETGGVRVSAKNKKKKWVNISFMVMLFFQLICMLWFANAKQGYFVDELWSYGLANSYYHPHIYSNDALEQRWVSGEYFKDYIEVSDSDRFKYGSVIYNQKDDNHPPLFYIVLHTISSLFPDTFSKWYGIVPNIVYFIAVSVLLFQLAKKLLKNEWLALVPVFAFGFSAGAISSVIYIRMYVLLMVWILSTLNLHGKWLLGGAMSKKELFILIIISYFGYMSHYYFFIFAFFVSLFYGCYLLVKRDNKEVFHYCIAMLGSLFLVAITFPTAYVKLFFGERGSEAVGNFLGLNNLSINAKAYFKIIGQGLFANTQWILLILILLGAVVAFIIWCRKTFEVIYDKEKDCTYIKLHMDEEKNTTNNFSILLLVGMIIFSAVGYFLIILKVAPYKVDRYVFGIYPVIMLMVVYFSYRILHCYISDKVAFVTLFVLFMVLSVKGIIDHNVEYIYPGYDKNIKIMQEHKGEDCLYVTWDYYKLAGNALELENMGRVYTLVPDTIEELPKVINPNKTKMIVYVDEGFNQKEIMDKICTTTGFTQYKKLFESRCIAYEVER